MSLYADKNAQEKKKKYVLFHRSLGISMMFVARRTQV
jgi:hypothetical protein